jgi:hypothetical protein
MRKLKYSIALLIYWDISIRNIYPYKHKKGAFKNLAGESNEEDKLANGQNIYGKHVRVK